MQGVPPYVDWAEMAILQAEGAGFEPAVRGRRTPVFKTGAFDHSATPPVAAIVAGAVRRHALHWPDPGEVAEWLKALAC
jgi:hypothetical protein